MIENGKGSLNSADSQHGGPIVPPANGRLLHKLRHFSGPTIRRHTSQFNPLELPDVTVLGVAGAVYGMSKQGSREYARSKIESLIKTDLFEAVAERLGFSKRLAAGIGIASVPTIIVISGLNIMAKGEHDKARRELAARGLLVYSEL